jgi:hypothetical protein
LCLRQEAPAKRLRGKEPEVVETALGDEVEAKIQQLLQYEDEKVALASQVYDNVDMHIRHLDEDLGLLKVRIGSVQRSAILGVRAKST